MQKLILIISSFLLFINVYATPIEANKAIIIANNFLNSQIGIDANRTVTHTQNIIYNGVTTMYAVGFSNKTLVLIAADDNAKPIIAYIPNANFELTNLPESFDYQLLEYKKQMKNIIDNNILANKEIQASWNKYSTTINNKGEEFGIAPLLTTIWAQGCYYNDSTPIAGGPCNHVVTGCVATAMAQVMNYYEHPSIGNGQHNYTSNYGILIAEFGTTNYDFSIMPDTLSATSTAQQVSQVAQLMSHCGIAVEMNYSAGASGAYSQDAANAFTHYFNYDINLQLLLKNDYPDSIWNLMVIAELDSLHPLYYDGSGSGGHAFVCDGYNSSGLFHFNWGWNGAYNGYFSLSNLNPAGSNFSNYCGAVFGMKPGIPALCTGITDTLIEPFGNISDGSYAMDYQNNADCNWLINPPVAASISLEFYSFNLAIGDTLFVYDGTNAQSSLIASYTGNIIPQTINSSSNSLFINFKSDGSSIASGWSAAYRSEFCIANNVFTNLADTISDGSGNATYNNNTDCNWLITDSLNGKIVLTFDDFKTESGFDYLYIYDGNSINGTLLGIYDGYNLPPVSIATSGSMFLNFTSDGGVVDDGWKAHYFICSLPTPPTPQDSALLCQGDSILLSSTSAADSIAWFVNGYNILNYNSDIYVSQAGVYYYQMYKNMCDTVSSTNFTLQIAPLPIPDLGNDTIICTYNPFNLSAGNFSAYLWNNGDTNQSILVDSNLINNFGNSIFVRVMDANLCINSDTIIVDLSPCISIDAQFLKEISVFPNPANNEIFIEGLLKENLEIRIINSIGEIVFIGISETANSQKIDISNFLKGIYFLKISDGENNRLIKFVKL